MSELNDVSVPTDAELSDERGPPAGRTEEAPGWPVSAARVFADRLVLANGKTVLPQHLAELRASGLIDENSPGRWRLGFLIEKNAGGARAAVGRNRLGQKRYG